MICACRKQRQLHQLSFGFPSQERVSIRNSVSCLAFLRKKKRLPLRQPSKEAREGRKSGKAILGAVPQSRTLRLDTSRNWEECSKHCTASFSDFQSCTCSSKLGSAQPLLLDGRKAIGIKEVNRELQRNFHSRGKRRECSSGTESGIQVPLLGRALLSLCLILLLNGLQCVE